MGLPRLGGQGGKGGDVLVVAKKEITLKKIKDKYPQKRFVAGVGMNSRYVRLTRQVFAFYLLFVSPSSSHTVCVNSVRSLKGVKGPDQQILAPTGVSVTTDNGKVLGESETDVIGCCPKMVDVCDAMTLHTSSSCR